MLPAQPSPRGQISDVAGNLLHALRGQRTPLGFPPVKKVALIVIDGLGTVNLLDHSGHARHLVARLNQSGFSLHSGIPSTTSTALASLTTGKTAGEHGMLGYSVLEPSSGVMLNHLKPFPETVSADKWQPCDTVFETLDRQSIPSLAVGEARFDGTDFTRAILRGSQFAASNRLTSHTDAMRQFFDNYESGLCYLYWPTLDRIGHSRGVGSAEWIDELEALNAWVEELSKELKPEEAAVLTADHGMVTVAEADRVVLVASDPLRQEIAHVGGEPRCVHLYLRDGVDHGDFLDRARKWVAGRGRCLSRREAVSQGVFGHVASEHLARIGDVVILASESWVFYDEATASAASYLMVGQHGSSTEVETTVPLIPLGVWAS